MALTIFWERRHPQKLLYPIPNCTLLDSELLPFKNFKKAPIFEKKRIFISRKGVGRVQWTKRGERYL
jgi:hypothetical protein